MLQTTIKKTIKCTGIGLHSGKSVDLTLRPAKEDTGIVFHLQTATGPKTITPTPEVVIATGLATTLGAAGAAVATVEHLLAACRGLNIDNLHIDVSGGEIPIMDGSAGSFVLLFNEAGITTQSKPKTVLRIKAPFTVTHGDKFIKAEPYDGFMVDYTISFPHSAIGTQQRTLTLSPTTFNEVAKARTFGFLQDVEMLKSKGLALGGSLANAIVLDERGVLNKEGLRYSDEFVRHKILDFIGDMAMMPLALQGKFTVYCSGHGLNNEFLRTINNAASTYLEEVTLVETKQLQKKPLQVPSVGTISTQVA